MSDEIIGDPLVFIVIRTSSTMYDRGESESIGRVEGTLPHSSSITSDDLDAACQRSIGIHTLTLIIVIHLRSHHREFSSSDVFIGADAHICFLSEDSCLYSFQGISIPIIWYIRNRGSSRDILIESIVPEICLAQEHGSWFYTSGFIILTERSFREDSAIFTASLSTRIESISLYDIFLCGISDTVVYRMCLREIDKWRCRISYDIFDTWCDTFPTGYTHRESHEASSIDRSIRSEKMRTIIWDDKILIEWLYRAIVWTRDRHIGKRKCSCRGIFSLEKETHKNDTKQNLLHIPKYKEIERLFKGKIRGILLSLYIFSIIMMITSHWASWYQGVRMPSRVYLRSLLRVRVGMISGPDLLLRGFSEYGHRSY